METSRVEEDAEEESPAVSSTQVADSDDEEKPVAKKLKVGGATVADPVPVPVPAPVVEKPVPAPAQDKPAEEPAKKKIIKKVVSSK